MNLWDVSGELSRRLSRIFLRDESGRRAVYGGNRKIPNGSTLEGPHSVSRIFPWGQRRGAGREPPGQAGPDWFVSCCSRVESNYEWSGPRAEPATTLKIAADEDGGGGGGPIFGGFGPHLGIAAQ